MQKNFVKSMKATAILTILSLACLNSVIAQEENPNQWDRTSFTEDKFIFVVNHGPGYSYEENENNWEEPGYYEIIVSPLNKLELNPKEKFCNNADLEIMAYVNSYNNYTFYPKACADLNNDQKPESIVWGFKNPSNQENRQPFILTNSTMDSAGNTGTLLMKMDVDSPIHDVRQSLFYKNGWSQLVLLDKWNSVDSSKITLRPMQFDTENQKYVRSKYTYDPSQELAFSSQTKKLTEDDFNIAYVGSLVLNRTGSQIGYIHSEGKRHSGFGTDFIAALDVNAHKFRHINVFHHPNFQKEVNQRYPGFLRKASQSDMIESDPIWQTIVGFQKRDLIFKTSVFWAKIPASETKFCGYWKFNMDTGNLSLVSWNSGAAINVEHTGYKTEIISN